MSRLRLWFKDLLVAIGLGATLTEYCEDCGVRMPLVWWAPNELWERVTGHATPEGDNAQGLLCPKCFDIRADKMGLLLQWWPRIILPDADRDPLIREMDISRELSRMLKDERRNRLTLEARLRNTEDSNASR